MSKDAQQGPSVRALRIGEQVRHILSELLQRGDVHDDLLAKHLVSITEVRMSSDLRHATVFMKPLLGRDEDAVLKALRQNTAFLQREVASRMKTKYAAKLKFLADESFDEGSHVERLLNEPRIARDFDNRSESADIAFLHGGGQGGWVWDAMIAALQELAGDRAGQMLALDVPGCGKKRGRDTADMTMMDIAAELIGDIEAAGLRSPMIVGHSQAGSAIAKMAELKPDVFGRIVHVTTSLPLPGQSVLEMIGQGKQGENADEVGWPFDPGNASQEQRNAAMFASDMDSEDAHEFLSRLEGDQWPLASYAERDWTAENLKSIPSVYVKCLQDRILPVEWQDRFARRLYCDKIVELDCGHQAMNSMPGALADILLHEMRNVEGAG